MDDLDALTKVCQDESVNIYDISEYLDAAIQRISVLSVHCSDSSAIITNFTFETAVIKIQSAQLFNSVLCLTHPETDTVKHLVKPQSHL